MQTRTTSGTIIRANQYRFSFEKKKKHICPSCRQKSFVLYVDNSTGDYLADHVGKCDRSNNCGEHFTPKQFFAEQKAKGIHVDTKYIPSVSEPIETSVFLPNTGQPLIKSYSFELSQSNAPEYLATANYLSHKVGIPAEKLKSFGFLPIKSRTYLDNRRKEIFTAQNFAFAIVPSDLHSNIKIKNPTAKNKAYKVVFAQSSGNYLYGESQLPPIDQRSDKTLFIVEGEEKAACINHNLSEYGFYAITRGGIFNGAYCEYFDAYRAQFKNVIVWYDYDSGKGAGQKAAQRLHREHGLDYVKHELYANDCNDINDIFIKYGKAFLLDIARIEVARLELLSKSTVKAQNITIQAKKGEYVTNILPQNGIDLTAEYLNNALIHAGTGTGKSKMTESFKGKRIVVCHTQALCENYIKNGAMIFNGSLKETSSDCEYYATTYKSLPNLMRRINPSEFFLFKDESHLHTTGASKDFMLSELSQCLDLEKQFKGVCHMTGTPIYNFDKRLEGLKTIRINVPKNDRFYSIIEYKNELPTIAEKVKNSIKNGRFPIVLFNNKGNGLTSLKTLLASESIAYLNSDTKKDAFFKGLTKTGYIDTDKIKGIVTTSVFTTGNDIYNELDFDYYVCGAFHSLEMEQFVSRSRKPLSINISILKSNKRKKIEGDFDIVSQAEIIRNQSQRRADELNNTPIQYRLIDNRAAFNNYALIQNNDLFEVNDLLLSNLVFKQERQFEYSNDIYQEKNLKKYGLLRLDNESDNSRLDKFEKLTIKEIKAANKAKKQADFINSISDIEATHILAESESEVVELLTELNQSESEGARFAAKCFQKLTEAGISPIKVSKLISDKNIDNDSKLEAIIKSIAISQLRDSKEYLETANLTALQILTYKERIRVDNRYTIPMLKNAMRDTLRLEKGFSKKRFDSLVTSHDVLEHARLFYEIKKDGNGFYKILDTTFFDEYYIETKSKKVVHNKLIIN